MEMNVSRQTLEFLLSSSASMLTTLVFLGIQIYIVRNIGRVGSWIRDIIAEVNAATREEATQVAKMQQTLEDLKKEMRESKCLIHDTSRTEN